MIPQQSEPDQLRIRGGHILQYIEDRRARVIRHKSASQPYIDRRGMTEEIPKEGLERIRLEEDRTCGFDFTLAAVGLWSLVLEGVAQLGIVAVWGLRLDYNDSTSLTRSSLKTEDL